MKQTKCPWGIKVFIATLVLTCFACFPAAVFADGLDDLDVTMEVMDDMAGIDDAILEMRGPEDDDFVGGDGDGDDSDDDPESDSGGFDDEGSDHDEDDFGEEQGEFEEHEDDFEDDDDFDEEDLDEEDDFEEEEGEDVDV